MSITGNTGAGTERLVRDDGVYDVDEDAEDVPANFNITSYGADFDVSGLIRRLELGDIVIPTFEPNVEGASGVGGFQRDFVWNRRQMDRFIESLLFGLPVPGIFLVNEPDGRYLVLDGSQRLRTLRYFYKGTYGNAVYRLGPHAGPFSGRSYEELDPEDRRRLDNSIIHATIIREDDPSGAVLQRVYHFRTVKHRRHEPAAARNSGGSLPWPVRSAYKRIERESLVAKDLRAEVKDVEGPRVDTEGPCLPQARRRIRRADEGLS